MESQPQTISKGFWIKLILAPIAMFGFAFALVPLYTTFCDITGLNGRTSSSTYQGKPISVDNSRTISIDFLSATTPGFPVKFYPKTKKLNVTPGKLYTVTYYAENRSDETIIGQAVPSVAPGSAASHLKKLECFCFKNQTFEPKVPVEMPVRFFIASDLDKDIKNITLSYNFLKIQKTTTDGVAGL
jgi:cytochrome c oxidase assembly protein subunit 11